MGQIVQEKNYVLETTLYSVSRTVERAAFYGIRSLMVLYMVKGAPALTNIAASEIYYYFVLGIVVSQVIGAVLGDLLLGNKNALLIGGLLQALGAFTLCIPSVIGLFAGLGLTLLGSGLYSSNIIARFGKIYSDKTNYLDAAITLLYTGVNLGAMAGTVLMVYLGDIDFKYGFIAGGMLMLISTALPLFHKENETLSERYKTISIDKRIIALLAAIVLGGLYWGAYEFAGYGMANLEYNLSEKISFHLPGNIWQSLSSFFIVVLGVIASIVWWFVRTSSLSKMLAGFVFGAVAFGLLLFIPGNYNNGTALIFILSMFILSISEILVAPSVYSVVIKKSNPKYVAIMLSLTFIPSRLLSLFISFVSRFINDNTIYYFIFSALPIGLAAIGLTVFFAIRKIKN